MKSGFNYGLVVPVAGVGLLLVWEQIMHWHWRRLDRRAGVSVARDDVSERLDRAEAALREANQEIASVRAELAAHR